MNLNADTLQALHCLEKYFRKVGLSTSHELSFKWILIENRGKVCQRSKVKGSTAPSSPSPSVHPFVCPCVCRRRCPLEAGGLDAGDRIELGDAGLGGGIKALRLAAHLEEHFLFLQLPGELLLQRLQSTHMEMLQFPSCNEPQVNCGVT